MRKARAHLDGLQGTPADAIRQPEHVGRYQPAEGVLSARSTDTVMLLDQRREQYHTLNEVGARTWELLVAGATLAQVVDALAAEYDAPRDVLDVDVRAIVETLLTQGLLRTKLAPSTPPGGVSQAARLPVEGVSFLPGSVSIRVPNFPRVALTITWVKLLLTTRGYLRTLEWIRHRVESIPTRALADLEQVKRVEYIVALTAALYPARAQCLERSLVLYLILRRQGVAVRYCQGAQPYPFKAHAWVECRGEVINDVPEHALAYARLPDQLP